MSQISQGVAFHGGDSSLSLVHTVYNLTKYMNFGLLEWMLKLHRSFQKPPKLHNQNFSGIKLKSLTCVV